MFIWGGPEKSLLSFMSDLKKNNNNIRFEFQWDCHAVHFLDLIFRQNESLATRVYFKQTYRNSYLLTVDILNNLKHKFVQKGYREATINQEIQKNPGYAT